MKKVIGKIVIGSMVFMLGTSIVFSEPGSERDPLVSISYVDKKIDELKNYIDSKSSSAVSKAGEELEIVNLERGQALIGESGTEIILRSGKATALASEFGGLADLTSGKDIVMGEEITSNHLLLIPRTDQRGAYALTDAIFMVRGSYNIR